MKMSRTTAALAVAALTFGLAACGGGDDDAAGDGGGDEAASSPLAEAIANDMIDDGGVVNADGEATCWANKVVDDIGEERLNELGITVDNPGGFDDAAYEGEEIDQFVEAMFDCVDVSAMLAKSFADSESSEAVSCIADGLDEDMVKTIVRSTFSGETPPADAALEIQQLAAECGVESA